MITWFRNAQRWLRDLLSAWHDPFDIAPDTEPADDWDEGFPDSMPPPTTGPSDQMKLEAMIMDTER